MITLILVEIGAVRVKRIVGGIPADVPPADDPVVYTRFNGRAAKVIGVLDFPHYVFRGIRYAHPPTDADRFLRPRELFLEGEVNATQYPPPCVQPIPGRNQIIGKEDCLFLNIFTPELPSGNEGLPVVIWIHGGGFRFGSASQYGVRHLVGKRLVVVTIQYRLGSLGFLSAGTKEMPGNAALWDMALAVQWVRNYISFFGGNPFKIVVMGHDVGASSALLIALSNIAKGMSSGVIAMSGTAVSHWAMDSTPKNTIKEVADQNGCPTTSVVVMVKCLQKVPPESIIKGDSNIQFDRMQMRGFESGFSGRLGSAPVNEGQYDGRSLPSLIEDEPLSDLYKQKNPKIPLLTGIVRDETKKAVNGRYKDEFLSKLKSVPDFLEKHLISKLHDFIGLQKLKNTNGTQKTSGIFSSVLNPLQFKNYLQTKANNAHERLEKISEATADALFNVPAFLTAELWSKKDAPTYLYRFDHCGKRKKGHYLLNGIPMVGNSTTDDFNDTVSHGDDLAYIFDIHDIEGRSLESDEPLSEDDTKVREIYTQMIADFAHSGSISINNQKVAPFSSTSNNFIQIKPKPMLANNFRFCEMALWCGIAERLKSNTCQFLQAVNTQIKNVEESVKSGIGKVAGKVGLNDSNKKKVNEAIGGMLPFSGGNNKKSGSSNNPLGFLG